MNGVRWTFKHQNLNYEIKRLTNGIFSSSEPSQIYPDDACFKCNIPNKEEEMCTIFSCGTSSAICLSLAGSSLCQTKPLPLNLFCRQAFFKAKWRLAKSWLLSTWACRSTWPAHLAIKWLHQIVMQCFAISWKQRWHSTVNQQWTNVKENLTKPLNWEPKAVTKIKDALKTILETVVHGNNQ